MKSFIALVLTAAVAANKSGEVKYDDKLSREVNYGKFTDAQNGEFGTYTLMAGTYPIPESVFYDAAQDATFISNFYDKGPNGYISRFDNATKKMTQKWATKNLVAPKGIFVKGDTLWVSDNKNVHSFDSKTGDWKTTLYISKAVFLNDVTVDADDNVYVTDSGIGNAGTMKSSAYALYKFVKGKGKAQVVRQNKDMDIPNGIVTKGDGFVVTSFGDKGIYELSRSGVISNVTPISSSIDGIEKVKGGDYMISSWRPKTLNLFKDTPYSGSIMRGQLGKKWTVEVDNINAPADIGYNSKTNELYVPMFKSKQVRIYSLDKWGVDRRSCQRDCRAAADKTTKAADSTMKKDGDAFGPYKECHKACIDKFQGASYLTLGATALALTAMLF